MTELGKRPLCAFAAAFLAVTAAALFAPYLLLFLALPPAFALVFARDWHGRLISFVCGGLLAALAVCGLFALRLGHSQALAGQTLPCTGVVADVEGQQLALVTLPDGDRRLAQLFPPLPAARLGDGFSGNLTIQSAKASADDAWLSGGVLLQAAPAPEIAPTPPTGPLPLAVRGAMLRESLCQNLLALSPAPATAATAGVLFSHREAMTPALRRAFSRSGMSHLMSVSGLHLSILVWGLLALLQKLGLKKLPQLAVGVASVVTVFFATGMASSVFRAGVMLLLTLAGTLLGRKSDGLTSLSLAAVLLVGICPPILADPSFLLSFLATLGILTLAPRFRYLLEQLCIARFGRVGWVGRLLPGLAVSAAAQLATLPVVAWVFGAAPLLGLVANLIAIPLVYPILVLGLAANLLLLLGLAAPAAAVLTVANLFSLLLCALAAGVSALPFCGLAIRLPLDFLAVGMMVTCGVWLAVRPAGVRRGRYAAVAITLALGLVVASALTTALTVTVVSAPTGSLVVASPQGAVLLAPSQTQTAYDRRRDDGLLERLGRQDALRLAIPNSPTAEALAPFPGLTICYPTPYVAELTLDGKNRHTKLMKYLAVYDTIIKYGGEIPAGDVILADRQGNLLSAGGKRYILRRGNGESSLRLGG